MSRFWFSPYTVDRYVSSHLRLINVLVADGHNMVPSNFEDPQRCKGRFPSLLLKHGHFVCCTIEHYLRVDIHLILLVVFLEGGGKNHQV